MVSLSNHVIAPRPVAVYCELLRLPTSTKATRFTPLQAITRFLPSTVFIMFRTTPPPDGIAHVWNFSVFGSNRTSVFGLTADSLYHTMSSDVTAMPYGCDLGPLGDGYSVVLPVFVSNRPR